MYKSLESKIRDMLEGKTGAISVTKDRDTMEHDPNDQVTVGTYKSKHFEISPEAQKLFSQGIPKNSNAIDAEHLAIHHDKLFALVKGAMVKKQVSDTDLENAKDHMSKIQYLATKLGLEGKIIYLQPHVEKLFKHAGTEGNPFTSKPTEYTQEPRDFDVDNTKQFITRAAKAERKVKVIDDEFNPEETEMVADKNLGANPAVVEAAKKVMEKLDPVGKEDKDVNNDGKVDSTDGYLKKRRNAISSAMRAARQKEVQKKVDAESKKQWKKPPQAGTLSAMKKEEVELDEMDKSQPSSSRGAEGLALGKKANPVKPDKVKSDALKILQKQYKKVKEEVESVNEQQAAVTNNPGHGYHGQHSDDADQKYSKMHARVRTLTGTNSTMAKHYLDSTHGRHLAGNEGDSEYIKRDFLKFAKKYNADQFKEEVEQIDEKNKENADRRKMMDAEKGAKFKSQGYYTPEPTSKQKDDQAHNKMVGRAIRKMTKEEAEQVDEGSKRMSAAVKLQRAFDKEKTASDASRKRGEEMLAQARAEYAKKQAAKTNEEVEQIDEIGNTEKGVKRLKDYVASDRSKVKIKDVLDAKRSADPDKAIEKLAKRQGYKSKALKKIRAFDAAKNPKPPEKEVPMGLKVYPPDMKYHGDSYEPTGDQTLDERNMENKAKKDNATRQIGAHAYIQGVKKDMQSPKIAGREVMKDPKLGSKKVADIYRKLPNPMKKEEVEQVDEVNYKKYLKVSQEKRPLTPSAVAVAMSAEKEGNPNPARKLRNTQDARKYANKQLTKQVAKTRPAQKFPVYEPGRKYVGDSVELDGPVIDENNLKSLKTEDRKMKYIEEKLTAADPASKWISDFVKSDNPKFAGKSKKERIQQALGAYYAAKGGKNEEVEQVDEFVDRETRLAARKAETGSSTRVSSGDVLGRRGGHETPKHAIARRVGKDSYGIKSGGKTSIYNRLPKPNLPEEAEQVDEQDDSMEKKEMAQTQLHFIKYAAEEILAFIDMGGEVEEWYQNKLSKVQSEVESLHSYIEGEKRRTGMVEEVEQVDEGRRGRPPKDPVARAKFYAAVMDEPDQHIMMQLKKASDSEKPYHVTFKDGQKHPVEPGHAKKVIGKYMAMKPDEKKVYQKKIAKSHEHFMKAATEVEKPVAKKPLDQKQRMAAIARVAMKYKNKGRDKSFGDTAD